jgi:DNA-binding NarL/FixJ family response regulator
MIHEELTRQGTIASTKGYLIPSSNRQLNPVCIEAPSDVVIDPAEARSDATTLQPPSPTPRPFIAIVDQHSFTRGCITKWLADHDKNIQIISFASADDCLQSASAPDLILYHAHDPLKETTETRLASMKKLIEFGPIIILAAADNPELLVEAFDSGVRGYVPTASTPVELLVEIIHLVRAGGMFVPPSSLSLYRTKRKNLTANTISNIPTNDQFTPRQIAVLKRLMKGKANKMIAYELSLSESTVKIHIRNIMKKLNASNRTEVVCMARAFSDTLAGC